MHIIFRRFLAYFTIIVFIIASCFFVFISFGYRYNFIKNKFEKTSVLYIKSYPRDANVLLNDKKYKKTTPTQINYLKPDVYKIQVEKEKYQKWEKQIRVRVDETVFFENTSLFFTEARLAMIEQGDFQEISISPNKEMILFYDKSNKNLNIFDIKSNNIANIEKNISELNYTLWSSDNQKILFESKNKYFVSFPYLSKNTLDLSKHLNFKIKSFSWDKFNSDILYIIDFSDNLYKFDVVNLKLENTGLKNILAVKPEGDKIFYVQKQKDQTIFTFYRKNSKDSDFIVVPYSNNYKFLEPYRDYFCLLDGNSNKMYLMDPNQKDYILKTIYNIDGVSWDLYNRILLLKNDFEIRIYDIKTQEEKTILRSSQKIDGAFWHRNNNHIFYKLNNELRVLELDDRWGRNEFLIKKDIISNNILTNRRGNIIYYITKEGLVKNTIQ
ncbi:MAG: PEGA domain-containing protein [Patescibacteria group bacterium]|nr:PEGA domain-containing protein [Patescibacteria group bacterium]